MSEFRRQHPVAAVTQLLAVLRQNFITFLLVIFFGSRNSGEYFWYFFLFGIVMAAVLGVFSWFRFYYRVIGSELQIKKGIFIRKNIYLSKDRIQVINITEGFIQRLFGLVSVEVKTAGSGTENAKINAISRTEAEELRTVLRTTDEPAYVGIEEEEVVIKSKYPFRSLSAKQLMIAALTSGNFGVIASILGAISGQMDELINQENVEYVMDHVPMVNTGSVWLEFFILLFVVSYLLSIGGVILRFYNFKVEKKEKELHITSGLLERKNITVPFNRIQAIRFVEGVLRQPFGYGMLYVESAGFEQKDQHKSLVLFPLIRKDQLEQFFNEFIPEYYVPEESIKPPERAFIKYLRKPNYILIPLVPLVWYFWSFGWLLFFLMIPLALYGRQRFKDAELSFDSHLMKLQYRVFAKTTALVRRNRVQVSDLSVNPFQRRKDLCHLTITAASGAGGKLFSLHDMDGASAMKAAKWAGSSDKVN